MTSQQREPKVLMTNPEKLTASESAKSAAKLRSKSGDFLERPVAPLKGISSQWSLTSWQEKPITQDVVYDDYTKVERALEKLESLPPLVHPREIEELKRKLRDAANGNAFILQGGDCAELFDYCNQERIEAKLKVLLQMSLVLIWGTKLPVVRIGRIAGQYAKPRSKLTEQVEGYGEVPSFRGDNINGYDPSERTPDPSRLVSAYFHSAATLNFIRSSLASGLADLHRPSGWDLSHVRKDSIRERYQEVVNTISEGLEFMSTVGGDNSSWRSIDFYTSHEALLLEYEQSLTRKLKDPSCEEASEKWYNTSAHFIWIGDRTRQPTGAHVEFFRGVANPIGIKVGPSMKTEELVELLHVVDPYFEPGRVTLITRYGAEKIRELLPHQIRAVQESGHKVVWISDPCHGNTKLSPVTRLKTRYFDDIIAEIRYALQIHKEAGSRLNGLHLELTGDAVTECIGGSQVLEDEDLVLRYDTFCDPRLSLSQCKYLLVDYGLPTLTISSRRCIFNCRLLSRGNSSRCLMTYGVSCVVAVLLVMFCFIICRVEKFICPPLISPIEALL
jgi:3-deoxy-7-phosphoheptulonate synthase